MECSACLCVIGENYSLSGGLCSICGYQTQHEYAGTYLGKSGNEHWFRIHLEECPHCGFVIKKGIIRCSLPNGIEVTEEFRMLVFQ